MRHYLVDRIGELEPGVRAVGVKAVALSDDCFEHHFPGNPIFPGIYILEGMAQTAGVLLARTTAGRRVGLMASIDRVKFSAFARPGDQVVFEIVIESLDEAAARVRGTATVGNRAIATARFTFRLVDVERLIPPVYRDLWRHQMDAWTDTFPDVTDG